MFVPGYTGSKEDFLAILTPVSRAGHRAVAIDLRGQFETPGSEEEAAYGLDELAADVLALIEVLGGWAHLVGHSFGGFVTGAAATASVATDPAATVVRSLALIGSGPSAVTGEGTRMSLALLTAALPEHDMETIWAAKRALEHQRGDPEVPAEIEDFLHARFVRNHPLGLSVAAAQLLAPDDRTAALAALSTPLLVLYGEREDVWAPSELAAMAARIGAGAQLLPGAGHSPAVDDPDATAAALVELWSRAEAATHPG